MKNVVKLGMAGIIIGVFGCTRADLPVIRTTHHEMVDPVQVRAVFNGFSSEMLHGKTVTNYQFTVERPRTYKGKVVRYTLFWNEFDTTQLIPGSSYFLTVPQKAVEGQESVCDWGLEFQKEEVRTPRPPARPYGSPAAGLPSGQP